MSYTVATQTFAVRGSGIVSFTLDEIHGNQSVRVDTELSATQARRIALRLLHEADEAESLDGIAEDVQTMLEERLRVQRMARR